MFRKLDAALFYGLLLPRLSKTYTGAAAVLVDEFDASLLEGSSYNIQCRPARFMRSCLELTNRYNPYCRFVRQLLLTPIK